MAISASASYNNTVVIGSIVVLSFIILYVLFASSETVLVDPDAILTTDRCPSDDHAI